MKKIHSQLTLFTRIPPRSTPTAPPMPAIAPQMPSALLRSAPSRKVVVRSESAAGEMMAAPSPWIARNAISWAVSPDRPHASDATENSTMPPMNSRRRPSRSAVRPPSIRKPPNVSV